MPDDVLTTKILQFDTQQGADDKDIDVHNKIRGHPSVGYDIKEFRCLDMITSCVCFILIF